MLKLPRQEIKNQLVKLRKQHNYVKPAISEYQGNCEGLVDSQPGLNKATQSYVYSRPRLTSERPRGQSVLAHYNRYLNVEVFTVVAWLTDWQRGPQTVGLNSPWCHTLRSSCDLVSIYEILQETVLARNFYQSQSRLFHIWDPAFREFYFRLHQRRTNVYFIKISACHNKMSTLRTVQDQGRKVCTV